MGVFRNVAGVARAVALLPLFACTAVTTSAPPAGQSPLRSIASDGGSASHGVELRVLPGKPRMAIVPREGDPMSAMVVAIAIDEGPVAAAGLAAILETRLRVAGFSVEARADRYAVHVRIGNVQTAQLANLFAAVNTAFAAPVVPDRPEILLARTRLAALRRHPLEAPELVPIASCTGQTGLLSTDAVLDFDTPDGLRALESFRRKALNVDRTAIAAVGPEAFCAAAIAGLAASSEWERGAPSDDAPSVSDTVGVYTPALMHAGALRVTVAMRVPEASGAVAAASRLGFSEGPLATKLASLPEAFRATEIVGVARPRGGCVMVSAETDEHPDALPVESTAATVASLIRREIAIETRSSQSSETVFRTIAGAGDPRDAGARAAWWALAADAPGMETRSATVVAVAPRRQGEARLDELRSSVARELDRTSALAASSLETKVRLERGQGELWMLLANPCATFGEGVVDAGSTAIAAVSAALSRPVDPEVQVEPWVTSDGIGVIAHGAARSGESATTHASRVAEVAARTLAIAATSPATIGRARAVALGHLEDIHGRNAAAVEAFALAISPDHPSWLEPFGSWNRVADGGVEAVRFHWSALLGGPLRLAVVANTSLEQPKAAELGASRWLSRGAPFAPCAATRAEARPGHRETTLARGANVAHAMVGAAITPPHTVGFRWAELAALALSGDDGLVALELAAARSPVRARVSIAGGSRASALAIDLFGPPDALAAAVVTTQTLLARLGASGISEGLLDRAWIAASKRDRDSDLEPRHRLLHLWSATPPAPLERPAAATLTAWFAATFAPNQLVIVEPKAE